MPDRSTAIEFTFPRGYPTTEGTVKLLAEAVRFYHTHPVIRRRAREITAGIPSMDYDADIEAVWSFLHENVKYMRDPLFAEYVTSPVELDRQVDEGQAAEDCEGVSLYAATLLAAMGIESEFVIMGRNPQKPQRFTHCALRVKNPRTKQWTEFDLVGAWAYPGRFTLGDSMVSTSGPVEYWSLDGVKEGGIGDLFGDCPGVSGDLFDDCLGDSFDDLQNVKKYGGPAADTVSTLGPYGMIIGGLFKGATALADTQIKPSENKPVAFGTTIPKTVKPQAGKGTSASSASTASQAASIATQQRQLQQTQQATTLRTGVLLVGAALLGAKLLGVI
jgi:hypothetical protein